MQVLDSFHCHLCVCVCMCVCVRACVCVPVHACWCVHVHIYNHFIHNYVYIQNAQQESCNYYLEITTEPTHCTVTMESGRGYVLMEELGPTKQPMLRVGNLDMV